MSYRDDVKAVRKEVNWTFWKILPLFILIVSLLTGLGFGLKSLGLLGGTIVEREIFENSYQRSASITSRIAVDEAQLIEIERKLMNPELDKNTRFNLEAQKSAINVRLITARELK